MQPYQKATDEYLNQKQRLATTLTTAGSAAIPAAKIGFAAKVAEKALPFLSKYIPEDLAIKGLSKVSPKLGGFVKSAMDAGHSFEDTKGFIQDKIEKFQEPPKENRNILEQYSPELFSFIKEEVQKGRSALQAGAIAQNDKRFMSVIKKITQDHKTPWSAILQSVFGQEEGKAPKMAGNTILDAVRGQAQPQQPEAQQGQGNAKLMALLQQINQRLG